MNRFKTLSAALVFAAAGVAGVAWAGSRDAQVAVVAVHDDSDPGSKACLRRVLSGMSGEVYVRTTLARASFLKGAGVADGDALLRWTRAQLRAGLGKNEEAGRDMVVAVDCRPAAGVLRVVATTWAKGPDDSGLNLRFDAGGTVDTERMQLVATLVGDLVWRDINY